MNTFAFATKSNLIKGGIIAVAMLTAAGCQNTKALDEVRAIATRADQNASAALTAANSAQSTANAANSTAAAAKASADAAQSTANQALQAANAAQTSVDATNEKLDRMFKKSMQK